MSIAWVRCDPLPEPDPDEEPALAALRSRGLEVEAVDWHRPPAPQTHAVWVLRACWDYIDHVPAFRDFLARVASRSVLLNPLGLVLPNLDKGYLRDLRERGVPTVPTVRVDPRRPKQLEEIAGDRGWTDVVIKPAIGAASRDTRRFDAAAFSEGEAALAALLESGRAALVQPYMSDVEVGGERALVWIEGKFTHSVRKTRRMMGDAESVGEALPIATDERVLGEVVLRPWASRLAYARVDVVRDRYGVPMVMEVELIEPSLFLAQHPPALDRFVEGLADRHAAARRAK